MNKTTIAAALRAVQTEKVLSENSGTKGGGSLLLIIRRATSGSVSATWFAKWKAAGKTTKRRLGTYETMTVEQAREAFKREAGETLAGGRDPVTAAKGAENPTVERLFQARIEAMKAEGTDSWPEVQRALLTGKYNAAASFGRDKQAGAVTADDVAAYLGKAYKRGSRVMADRTRAYLSAAFNWGIQASHDYTAGDARQDWGIKLNPAHQVKRDTAANKARSRALDVAEMKLVWAGIQGDGYDPATTAAVRMMFCCGQRARETLRAEGSEIDLDAGLWNMPAHKTKGKKNPHVIPLPHQAVEIFRELKEVRGNGWLFPSCAGSKLPHMTDGGVSRALRRLMKDKDMEPFQQRDMRRTWKTRTGEAGVNRFIRDRLQQHAQTDTGSKHYDQWEYLTEKTAAMAAWAEWLDSNVVGKQQPKPQAMAA